MKTILTAVLSLLLSPVLYAGDYGMLAAELARSAGVSGLNRFAVVPFKAAEGIKAERAAQVQRLFSRALYEIPGTGVMDAEVLKELDARGGYWAQVLVYGSVHRAGDGEVLLLRAVNKRGKPLANLQVKLYPQRPYPADFRDAPADPRLAGCEKKLALLDEENRNYAELKARYWAARARTPGFSYQSLPRAPGSELRDYAVMQDFYRLLNKYYEGAEPVLLQDSEQERLKELMEREEKVLAECPQGR